MDFKDSIKQLAERILKTKDLIQTEEATKHSFVMPFIQSLGYDVFNPLEVVPEFVADLGLKKGEKIDYAIMKDGETAILVECKHWSANLDPHNSQLFRYFHTCKAKFSMLTNGIETRFYTDLDQPNRMDEKPFFIFKMTDLRENNLEELKKFHKSYFDTENIVSSASELKFCNQLKVLIKDEVNSPTPEFVKYFSKQIYAGVITPKLLEQFTALTQKTFQQFISDEITQRLKTALKKENQEDEAMAIAEDAKEIKESNAKKITTTQEEIEGFYIVRALLRQKTDVGRIVYRDAQTYFAILLDDNNRKPICRLYLNGGKKYISLFNNEKKMR